MFHNPAFGSSPEVMRPRSAPAGRGSLLKKPDADVDEMLAALKRKIAKKWDAPARG